MSWPATGHPALSEWLSTEYLVTSERFFMLKQPHGIKEQYTACLVLNTPALKVNCSSTARVFWAVVESLLFF